MDWTVTRRENKFLKFVFILFYFFWFLGLEAFRKYNLWFFFLRPLKNKTKIKTLLFTELADPGLLSWNHDYWRIKWIYFLLKGNWRTKGWLTLTIVYLCKEVTVWFLVGSSHCESLCAFDRAGGLAEGFLGKCNSFLLRWSSQILPMQYVSAFIY